MFCNKLTLLVLTKQTTIYLGLQAVSCTGICPTPLQKTTHSCGSRIDRRSYSISQIPDHQVGITVVFLYVVFEADILPTCVLFDFSERHASLAI